MARQAGGRRHRDNNRESRGRWAALRYLELNPARAGLVGEPDQYPLAEPATRKKRPSKHARVPGIRGVHSYLRRRRSRPSRPSG